MTLGHIDGIIFLVLFVGYLLWMIQSAKKARAAVLSDPGQSGQIEQAEFVEENIAILPTWKSLIFIIGGMIAIKFGGDFVVDGASSIASRHGTQPDTDRTYDRSYGNQSSGTCHLTGRR